MAARCLLLFCLVVALGYFHASGDPTYSSTSTSSEGIVRSRHLLQVLKQCPVNFQVQNYTIITSECKGPSYPVNACCNAFVKFACPFAAEINDNTTDCASTMFNYINIYGSYPAGLFANECVGDQNGLPCPANATVPTPLDTSSTCTPLNRSLWWMISILGTIVFFGLCGA